MLKKRVLKRLLPLLFSFCCVFSGFLSVNVFAYTTNYPHYDINLKSIYCTARNGNTWSTNLTQLTFNQGDDDVYHSVVTSPNTTGLRFNMLSDGNETDRFFTFPVDTDLYDYYYVGTIFSNVPQINVTNVRLGYGHNSNIQYHTTSFNSIPFAPVHGNGGTSFYGKIDSLDVNSAISYIELLTDSFSISGNAIYFHFCIVYVDKSSEDALNAIVSAIQDQYSGEPEEEFSVEDVITQHNEKMGVLSFGSDVMLQFLDMFQSANVGTAELTLPGFNITVENVEYSVWPDYSFNFEQLNEWVPALMSVIRVMLPAFVWLMVLRYCIKVFEDNFLAK